MSLKTYEERILEYISCDRPYEEMSEKRYNNLHRHLKKTSDKYLIDVKKQRKKYLYHFRRFYYPDDHKTYVLPDSKIVSCSYTKAGMVWFAECGKGDEWSAWRVRLRDDHILIRPKKMLEVLRDNQKIHDDYIKVYNSTEDINGLLLRLDSEDEIIIANPHPRDFQMIKNTKFL